MIADVTVICELYLRSYCRNVAYHITDWYKLAQIGLNLADVYEC